MGKNVGGNKQKSKKNNNAPTKNREIPVPESSDNSFIAIIKTLYSTERFSCNEVNVKGINDKPFDTQKLSSGIKRKFGRGIKIEVGSYVLCAPREFNKKEIDIIFIYRDTEISFLISEGHMIFVNKNNGVDDVVFSEDAGATLYSKNEGDDNEGDGNDNGFEFV